MLIKLLPQADRDLLLKLAKLLSISDNPLLWGGKKYEEITSDTDLNDISIQANEQENELLSDLEHSAGFGTPRNTPAHNAIRSFMRTLSPIEKQLIDRLKAFPINAMELPENRAQAAKDVIRDLLSGNSTERPEVPKIMLFELILVAIRDGSISNIEQELLKEFQLHYQLENFIFDDLLERAEALNNEVSKTIAIVLE